MTGVTMKNKEGLNTLCNAKREYFSNLDIKNVSVNKMFWKAINPFFLDKDVKSKTIMLTEKTE